MLNRKRQRQRLLAGLLFSAIVGLFAYRRRSLSRSGVAGAIMTGSVTVGMGGWAWGLSLIYFFASSSYLSHFRSSDKERTAADKFSKGSQRDFFQVMANGGVATALAIAHGLTRSQPAREVLKAGYTGTLATANGDTWATELGVLNTRQPRLITTGKPVAPGTSGGITLLGTGASAAGGLSLGLVFWLLERVETNISRLLRKSVAHPLVGTDVSRPQSEQHMKQWTGKEADAIHRSLPGRDILGKEADAIHRPLPGRDMLGKEADAIHRPLQGLVSGLAGSLVDSLMGATLQAMYYCPLCQKETERRVHRCGTATIPLRGIPWFDNDVVNFLATVLGALVGMGVHLGMRWLKKEREI